MKRRKLKLTIAQRIALIIVIPLAVLVVQNYTHVKAQWSEYLTLTEMADNVALFEATSEWIGHLQRERGRTAMFLAGGVDLADLQQFRSKSDSAVPAWQAACDLAKLPGVDGRKIRQDYPQQLAEMRARYSASNMELRKKAIGEYNVYIAQLMDLLASVANAKTTRGYGKVLTSIILLEVAGENAGQIRANASSLLVRDTALSPEEFAILIDLKAGVDINLKSPALALSSANAKKLADFEASASWVEVDRVVQLMLQRSREGGFGVKPDAFWKDITQVVDDINSVIKASLTEVQGSLGPLCMKIRREVFVSVGVSLAVLLFTTLFAVWMAMVIVSRVKRVTRLVDEVSTGSTECEVGGELLAAGGEIGMLAEGLHKLIQNQRGKAELARSIAQGDLSQPAVLASDRDTLGQALQQMMDVLKDVIRRNQVTCQAQKEGVLDARNDVSGLGGDYKTLAGGVNEALDSIALPILEGIEMLNEYARGDLRREMRELPGKQLMLTDGLRNIRRNILKVIEAGDRMYQEQKAGDIEYFIDESAFAGAYQKLAQGINEVVKLYVSNILTILNLLNDYARGDLSKEMPKLPGKQIIATERVNALRQNVLNLIADAQMLAEAGVAGELDTRADAGKHKGDFAGIVKGVNATLDAVVGPLNEAADVLRAAAHNNLTLTVNGSYQGRLAELKDDVNATMAKLNDALGQVAEAVGQVNSGAEQISDAAQSLSQGATEQAASLQEITSSMSEIASQTKTNAENANQANTLTDRVRKSAEKGAAQMTQMTEAMQSINVSSEQIAKIIKVIDDIAFQTNLLALNAAVEAARAGRHGKGFAVVADEVRNLAGRSAKAAKETADLIESSGARVNAGMQVANATADSFREIVEGIVKTSDLVGEIAAASNEQAQGVSQINIGLGQVDQVTQQNTANAEETASAAEELSGQARQLQHLIGKFRLGEGAAGSDVLPEEEVLRQRPALTAGGAAPARVGAAGQEHKDMLKWTEEFSVHNRKMDAQHQRLFALINRLYGALHGGKANEQAVAILGELADYTQTHFAEEEALMSLYRYPGLDEQLRLHRLFVEKVQAFQEQARAGKPLGTQMFQFLKDWLMTHIRKIDRQYSEYLPD